MIVNRLKIWLKAIRAPFFTATIIPVILGAIIAWYDTGSFMRFRFFLTALGAVFIHAGTNLANDYFDHISGCDEANPNLTPFSGGSRVIQEGLIAPKNILIACLAAITFGAGLGLYLNFLCGRNVVLILGLLGIFLGFFYSARPFQIGYRGFGELGVAIGFGSLMVMGSYFVQTQQLSLRLFLISVPLSILIALVLFINEFPDYASDKSIGKKTLVVILDKKRAIILYQGLLVFMYVFTAFLIWFKFLPIVCYITFLSLPLALKAFKIAQKNFDKIYELLPANALTVKLHFIFGLLLCTGLMLGRIFNLG